MFARWAGEARLGITSRRVSKMSGIKRAFDLSNLPQAMNDYRLMSSLFALERVQDKTAIESRSVESKPKAPAKFSGAGLVVS